MEKETIQKEAEILMRDFMERAQHAKTEMCRSEAMSDNPALLIVVFEPKQDEFEGDWDSLAEGCREMGLSRTLQCGMIPLIHKQDPAECLTDVIGSFPLEKFEYAFIAVEGYAETETDGKLPSDYQRGDMAKDFAENPFTTITETLVVHGYDWNLTSRFVHACHYKYDDRGLPVFSEAVMDSSEVSEDDERGRIDEIVYRGIQFLHLNEKASGILKHWSKPKGKKDEGR